jgi:hypothetical protein
MGVVHLTYGRANVTPEQKEWRPLAICQSLAPVVRCFVENVDPAKLDPEWFDPMRKCIDASPPSSGGTWTRLPRAPGSYLHAT